MQVVTPPVTDPAAAPVKDSAAPELTQAKPEPTKVEPAANPLDAVKQARYDATNAQLKQHQEEITAKAVKDAEAAKAAEQAKQAEADQIAKLTSQLTEAQTQASTLAERAKLAEKLEQISTLAKAGKHYEALQLTKEVAGADMDIAVQELINPGSTPKPVTKPADAPKEEEPAAVKALREQVEALTKTIADRDAAVAAANKEAGRKSIVAHVAQTKDQFPFLASNEQWVNDALADADKDYTEAVKANKDQDIDQEAKNGIIDKALKAAEAKHKEQAQNYAKILGIAGKTPNVDTTVQKPAPKPTLSYTGTGPGLTPAPIPTGKAATLEELKRARRAN